MTHPLEQVLFEVKRTIVGQDVLLERMAIGLLAGGHLLVEGVPGLAKTLAVKSLAAAIGGQFQRIQFTPDLVPADLIGTRVYRQHTGEFETTLGPVFTNLLLADEINRAPAKVQSALLEVMQERQVTIGRETHRDAATRSWSWRPRTRSSPRAPIPLPEAQVDRFMMKVRRGLSERDRGARHRRSRHRTARGAAGDAHPRGSRPRCRRRSAGVRRPGVIDYAVRLVTATRAPGTVGLGDLDRYVTYGASPRASIDLVLGARALAFLRGRDYALPHDVTGAGPGRAAAPDRALVRGAGRRRRPRTRSSPACWAPCRCRTSHCRTAEPWRPRPTGCCAGWSGG